MDAHTSTASSRAFRGMGSVGRTAHSDPLATIMRGAAPDAILIGMAGTKKLEAFDLAARTSRRDQPIITPVAEAAPATLAASRKSIAPDDGSRASNREPSVEQLRTRLARKFTTLADEVTECFEGFQIGAGAWGVELVAPEGMSTNGGKHATQHLRLRPKRRGHAVLVGGQVDPVAKKAELRDHAYMEAAHEARYGEALEITFDEWEQFLRKCEVVLRLANIEPTRVEAPQELRGRMVRRGGVMARRTVAIAALAVVVPLALLVAWRVLAVLFR